ncbi:hypothetical protein AAVH_28042 [Aphelenchoides avenae]|nr:hypothetical protein AAVH_28042 [Aphelenchus avenae]
MKKTQPQMMSPSGMLFPLPASSATVDPLVTQLATAIAEMDAKTNGVYAQLLVHLLANDNHNDATRSLAAPTPAPQAAPVMTGMHCLPSMSSVQSTASSSYQNDMMPVSQPSVNTSYASQDQDVLRIVAEALQRQQQQQQQLQQQLQQQRQLAEMAALQGLLEQQQQARQQSECVTPPATAQAPLPQTVILGGMPQLPRQSPPKANSPHKRPLTHDHHSTKRYRSDSGHYSSKAPALSSPIFKFPDTTSPYRHHPDNLPKRDPESCLLEDYATVYMLNGLNGVPQQHFQTTLENALSELQSNSPPPLTRMTQNRTRTDSAYASLASSRTASSSSPSDEDVIVLDDDEATTNPNAKFGAANANASAADALAAMPANGMNPSQLNAIRDFYANLVRNQGPSSTSGGSGGSLLGQLLAQ